jgi:Domain of Unknown Function (DUF1080)
MAAIFSVRLLYAISGECESMKLRFVHLALFVLAGGGFVAVVSQAADTASAAKADDKFVSLFNGKTLDGWHGDMELWKVVDGVIVGSTDDKQIKKNSFLITDKKYKDFVIKAKFRLRNHNSGIQFRSEELPDFACKGYQADMADKRYTGILHEEGGRIIVADVKEDEVLKHYTPGEWAEYVITADGPHIKQEINGYTTIDYTEPDGDKTLKEGIIALQLHAGPKMKVEFKDIEIKELPDSK